MKEPISVLILEDQIADAELMIHELHSAGFEPTWQCVETENEYVTSLRPGLDIILADYSLPQFDAIQALNILKQRELDIPFIVVTGTISEEAAVESMKLGADDYLLKDRLTRLGQAVKRALELKRLRDQKLLTEIHLRESEARFRRLAENAKDLIFRLRIYPTPGFDYVSPAAKSITGYAPEEFYADFAIIFKIAHPEDQHALQQVIDTRSYLNNPFVSRWITKEGATIWGEQRCTPVYDESGHLNAVEGIARDITANKLAEETIIRAKQEWERTFDSVPDLIVIIDTEYRITRVNKAMADRLGVSPKDVIGLYCYQCLHGLQERPAFCSCSKVMTREPNLVMEVREECLKGDFIITTSPLYDSNDQINGWVHVAHDITERKQAEMALRENEEKYRTIFEQSRDAIYISSKDGKFVDANQACLDLFGYSREVMMHLSALCLYAHPEDRAKFQQEIEKTGFVRDYEIKFRKKIGEEMDCIMTSNVRKDPEGHVLGYQGITRDITDRKRAETELKRTSEKLFKAMEGSIQAIASALEVRDPYTAGHQRRVSMLSSIIARELRLSEDQIEGLRLAGMVHDIGKISVPAEILSKPGKITSAEFSLIKAHCEMGYDILKSIEFPWPIAQIALQHHEKMDGSGYPFGLIGENILLEARILCVADVVEAMASHRPYRPALGIAKALEEISLRKGELYDDTVVAVCLRLFNEKNFKFD